MFKNVVPSNKQLIITLAAMLIVIVACGKDEPSNSTAAPASSPDNPATTATPLPVEPTAEPTEEPAVTSDTAAEDSLDLSTLTLKQLPTELDPDQTSTPLSQEEVEDIWSEYLTNTIQEFGNKEIYFHFCDGGYVFPVGTGYDDLVTGEPDSWSVGRNAAMSSTRWWETNLYAMVTYYTGKPQRDTLVTLGIHNGEVMEATEPYPVYESDFCEKRASAENSESSPSIDQGVPESPIARLLPDNLDPGRNSDQLNTVELEAAWTEYLSNSLVSSSLVNPAIGDLHLCADGIVVPTNPHLSNVPLFNESGGWVVERKPTASVADWWEATLVLTVNPESDFPADTASLMTLSVKDGEVHSAAYTSDSSIPIYESDYCTQLVKS